MRFFLLASVAVLGCKGDPRPQPGTPDAEGPADAAVDVMPDAMPQDVRVRVLHATPMAFVVLFYAPGGQLVARKLPDATGVASAMLPQGGTVIVVRDPVTDSIDELRAIFGVEPGDRLQVGPVIDAPVPSPFGQDPMAIAVPSKAGASVYRVGSRCGGGGAASTAVTMFVEIGCQGQLEVLAIAQDGAGQLVGAQRDTVTAGPSGTLSGSWLDPQAASLSVANDTDPLDVFAELYPMLDDRWLNGLGASTSRAFAAGESAALSFAVAPASTVDARLLIVALSRTTGIFQRFQSIHPPAMTASQLDVAAEQLPWYAPSTVNSYEVATRKLTLTRSAGAPLDGQLVRLQFRDEVAPPLAWNLVVPPDWTEVTLPALPVDLAMFDPSRPQLTIRQVAPTGISSSAYPGYAELRRGTPLPPTIGSFHHTTQIAVSPL